MAQEVVQRPVDRDERAWLHELDHPSLLLAVSVAAHVHRAVGPPSAQLDAASQEIVHHAHHFGLVAWNDAAREDDHVALGEIERRMLAAREPRERRGALALRSRRDGEDRPLRELLRPLGRATRGRRAIRGTAGRPALPSSGPWPARRERASKRSARGPRSCARAGARSPRASCSRWTFDANIATTTACSAPATIASSALPTPSSLPVGPAASMFVESLKRRSTPSRASSSKRGTSNVSPSGGASSNLKSPVCTTSPASVRIASAVASAIEWVTRMGSTSKEPTRSG